MAQDAPATIHLKDYRPAPYAIGELSLSFSLEPRATRVTFAHGYQAKSRKRGKKCGACFQR